MWLFQFEILKQKTSTREEREYNTLFTKTLGRSENMFYSIFDWSTCTCLLMVYEYSFFLSIAFLIYINQSHTVGYPSNIYLNRARESFTMIREVTLRTMDKTWEVWCKKVDSVHSLFFSDFSCWYISKISNLKCDAI